MISVYMSQIRKPEFIRKCFPQFAVVGALFFLSGFTTLVYEISWTRQLGNVFGNTVTAGSVVLASVFIGLAIGAYAAATQLQAVPPMLLFAGCEFLAAIWTLCVPWVIGILRSFAHAWDYAWLGNMGTIFQAICVISLLLPATLPLGATLPAIGRALQRDRPKSSSSSLPILYGLNTLGAMIGGVVCSYWMIMNFGVSGSSRVAACLGIGVAIVSTVYATKAQKVGQAAACDQYFLQRTLCNRATSRETNGAWWIAAVSGFVVLAFEVLYTRLFSLVFHNSTYTFGNIVTVFLLSLTLGSWLSALLQRRLDPGKLIPFVAIFAAVTVMVSLWLFVRISRLDYFITDGSMTSHLFQSFLLVAGVIVIPVMLLGLLFPLSWQLNGPTPNNCQIGYLAAINSATAALGAAMAGFVFLPLFGLWGSFLLLSGILILLGSLFSQRSAVLISAGLALALLTTIAVDSHSWQSLGLRKNEALVTRRESAYGWIDVTWDRNDNNWYLRENLHYRHGATGDQAARQKRQARLPLLLHSHPQDVLFLGLGTGMTAAGALPFHDVMKLDVVELIPDIAKAAEELGGSSDSIFKDERTSVIIDDARHYLRTSPKNYDVIVADLYVPWESQAGYLYTQEHFLIVEDRLNTKGLFCQWLPIYQLGEGELVSICDTFASVFPHTSLWWGKMDPAQPIIALVGSKAPIRLNEKRITSFFEKINANVVYDDQELSNIEHLRLSCLGDWKQQNSALNLDEFPRVEFDTPKSLMSKMLLKGRNFQTFYDDFLFKLKVPPIFLDENELISNALFDSVKATQRFLLFGSESGNGL